MLDLPVGTAKTRIRDGLIRLRDTMGVGGMSDIHALSGAYAVDALDDIERAQFERHLAECPACTAEVSSLREAAALLAETTAAAPSAGAARAGARRHRHGPSAAPRRGRGARRRRHRARRRAGVASATFLAAAAAVVAIGTGGVVWQQVNDDGPRSRTEQVLPADDAQRFTVELRRRRDRDLVRSKKLNKAVLVTKDMPAAPDGHAYALWLQHDDVMVPGRGHARRARTTRCCSAATPPPPTAPGSPSRPRARSRPSPATTSSPSSPSTPKDSTA